MSLVKINYLEPVEQYVNYSNGSFRKITEWKDVEMWINPTIIQEVYYIGTLDRFFNGYDATDLKSRLPLAKLCLTKDRAIAIPINSEDDIPRLLQELGLKVRAVTITKQSKE